MSALGKLRRSVGYRKGVAIRAAGSAVARVRPRPRSYRPGVTVVTVNWNSLSFLRVMLDIVRSASPAGTEILVVDNGSSDGSLEYLRARPDVRTLRLPVNVGHGVALDLVMPVVDTEYVAVLDIDAFPISDQWLERSITALVDGAHVAGARMHRNFVHPCFLVTRTKVLHELGLTFKPVGSLAKLSSSAPLFLDVGEALSQRLIVKFGGGHAIHFFEITSIRGPGNTGSVFGDLVYHNQYATQGAHHGNALEIFLAAAQHCHPGLLAWT